ncbi:MAG: hypothetical protein AABW81_03180 [Nanoarchaeota archaeon]
MKFNFINSIIFTALVALPLAGLMLHLKIHPSLTYLTYILWFDIVIISLLFLFDKTIFYGFVLNSVFFAVGVIAHLTIIGFSTIPDVLIAIPDFSLGYVLWKLNKEEKK